MSRLRKRMDLCKKEDRAALVLYLTFGDPSPDLSVDVVLAAVDGGADVIELGVPFSDPNADGPVIQDAMQRAIAKGAGLEGALSCVRALRDRGCEVPLVLFGYYNPLFVRGQEAFAEAAAAAGVDATLTVDLPIDEIAELATPLARHGIDVVPLVAPTSTPARIEKVGALAPPFVYYISRTGITGSDFQGASGGADRISMIRETTKAPVCVGFGIKTPEDAARVAKEADGVVVGSQAVRCIHEAGSSGAAEALKKYVASLRAAL